MAIYKNGSQGEQVKQIQKKLGITADGIYGPQTQAAVKNYQKANGLTVDGIVGPQTWGKLFAPAPTTGGNKTTPTPRTPIKTMSNSTTTSTSNIKHKMPGNNTNTANTTSRPSLPKLSEYKPDLSTLPTTPTMPKTPDIEPFSYNKSLSDYISQARQTLQPQYQNSLTTLNKNYNKSVQSANNDTLARGLARSSYAGNRIDQLNDYRNQALAKAKLDFDTQVNNLASNNYNTDYQRAYQQYQDRVNNIWNQYKAQAAAAQQQYQNAFNLWNTKNSAQRNAYSLNNQNKLNLYNIMNNNYNSDRQFNEGVRQFNANQDFNNKQLNEKIREFNTNLALQKERAAKASSNNSSSPTFTKQFASEIKNIDDLVNGPYNLSEKLRVMNEEIKAINSQDFSGKDQLLQYAINARDKIQKQINDYVNIGRYEGYYDYLK